MIKKLKRVFAKTSKNPICYKSRKLYFGLLIIKIERFAVEHFYTDIRISKLYSLFYLFSIFRTRSLCIVLNLRWSTSKFIAPGNYRLKQTSVKKDTP